MGLSRMDPRKKTEIPMNQNISKACAVHIVLIYVVNSSEYDSLHDLSMFPWFLVSKNALTQVPALTKQNGLDSDVKHQTFSPSIGFFPFKQKYLVIPSGYVKIAIENCHL